MSSGFSVSGRPSSSSAYARPVDRNSVMLKTAMIAFEKWGLTKTQKGALLNLPPESLDQSAANRLQARVTRDPAMRAALIVGIHNELQRVFSGAKADSWVTEANSNPVFAGKTPLETMLARGAEGMTAVREHLEKLKAAV
jgi:hypothetical protein